MPDVLTGDDRIVATQHIFKKLVDMLYCTLVTTFGRAEVGKRNKELLKYKEFLDIVFEKGDYGFENSRLYDFYCMCAIDQAQMQKIDKTIEYLNFTFEHLRYFLDIYNNKNKLHYTSFLVDRCEDDPSKWGFSGNPILSHRDEMQELLQRNIFDFVRNDSAFIMLVEELKKISS